MSACTPRWHVLAIALAAALSYSAVASAQDNTAHHHKKHHKHHKHQAVNVGEVSSNAVTQSAYAGHTPLLPSQKKIFRSGISSKVLGRAEIEAAGPAAGGAQMLSYAPGVNVLASYGTGAAKAQISIDGIKQGWGNPKGSEAAHSIAVEFDGIPMNNPATGLWQSPQVNQSSLIQGIHVTYGPGNPENRWYNNIGGSIDFVPLQPTAKPGASVGIRYGSYDFKNIHFDLRTGNVDGFSAILAGGVSSGNSFLGVPAGTTLYSPSGVVLPSHSYAWFLKIRKTFHTGDDSFGAYLASGSAYKPYDIPLSPASGTTINGYDYKTGKPIPGPLYSEQTSGFYNAAPYKIDSNSTWMFYNKLNVDIGTKTWLHNDIWYRYGHRLHNRYASFAVGAPNTNEYNDPHSETYGDKLWFDTRLPYNKLAFGGYFIKARDNSKNAFFSSYPPYNANRFVPNDKYRSDFLDVTNLSAFFQDKIHIAHTFDITPGVRVEQWQLNYTPYTTETFPESTVLYPKGNESKLPADSRSLNAVEPSVNISWRPIQHLALFASYSEANQIPAFGGGGGPFQKLPGNSISLEKGQNYQAGFKVHVQHDGFLHHFLFSANWYFTRFSDQYLPITEADGTVINAFGTSDYQGVNLYAVDNPIYWLHLFGNLSLQQAHFSNYYNGKENYSGLPVANVPDSTFNIGAYAKSFVYGFLLEPRIWVQYTGPQALYDSITKSPSPTAKLPAYTLLNLALHSKIPMHLQYFRNIAVDVDLLNVAGNRYNSYEYISSGGTYGPNTKGDLIGLPGEPRTFYVSLTANF
ncbi:TonB-dependent receptor [Acidithiobacillus sp. CV18-2]|uniref:TonB-dependent receptor n=1 Tax=Igneacidithiobacillus copahuensis TaxID=2724909 RepID=A0AAE3CJT8_9PROT|nr:TonB-dependent receptor [Igneacidithiobacillus copahuensis]MBU2755459.1 TonB-dependent receptor [Acidithiobacillus sp. CV18-3]MBU2757895.1 TonB-dependent receptor [Acidithiobacillus sp. BN09-2]MBU2778185.1 TonB-dependent receptor [Acidithiobacillus sp. CV18-2]MBU2797008.1 TonB-dependent receptor [Acidithiobacillus sp. VAN18-2]MBU2800538.1 TonB-dependent receptor [Acidithiobacillus sp. VAN18-4]UTV80489.1 TonB-dependent receptor [Acidithiobacillus sp. YTS05]